MSKKFIYKVKVNGKLYEVEIEEVGGSTIVSSSRPISSAASPSAPSSQPSVPVSSPAPAPTNSSTSASNSGANVVKAPIPGKVLSIKVKEGDQVEYGQTLLVFEAMKMENEVKAPKSGIVKKIFVSEGANFNTGDPLVEIE